MNLSYEKLRELLAILIALLAAFKGASVPWDAEMPGPTATPALFCSPFGSPLSQCEPVITGISPGATKHGQKVEVTVEGHNLFWPKVLLIGRAFAVEPEEAVVVGDTEIKCVFDLTQITVPWTQKWKLQVQTDGGMAEHEFFVED